MRSEDGAPCGALVALLVVGPREQVLELAAQREVAALRRLQGGARAGNGCGEGSWIVRNFAIHG